MDNESINEVRRFYDGVEKILVAVAVVTVGTILAACVAGILLWS